MIEKMYISSPGNTDLNVYRCGIEDCSSGHSWGPAVRDHYIIHYVLGGKGVFQVNNQTYELGQNDCFMICPNTVVYYRADTDEPWSYAWVGFNGIRAEAYLNQAGIRASHPVFEYSCDSFLKDCLLHMIDTKNQIKGREIRLLGLLYEFLARLIETAGGDRTPEKGLNHKDEYIAKALEFIHMNYSRRINICEIARHVGLDRSYLYLLFQEYVNVSPQEYLITFRMDKACELMKNCSLSIGDISRSVGYEDPLQFSKAFKKEKGLPPKDYRKIQK